MGILTRPGDHQSGGVVAHPLGAKDGRRHATGHDVEGEGGELHRTRHGFDHPLEDGDQSVTRDQIGHGLLELLQTALRHLRHEFGLPQLCCGLVEGMPAHKGSATRSSVRLAGLHNELGPRVPEGRRNGSSQPQLELAELSIRGESFFEHELNATLVGSGALRAHLEAWR